jgi:hypothetical protein
MKKYKILNTVSGVKPGDLHPTVFEKDSEHHIDDDLASQLYDQGAIDLIEDAQADETDDKSEEKSKGAAPSNKNRGAAPSNKAKVAE